MSIGVLIITHDGVGAALLKTAGRVMASAPVKAEALSVPFDCDCERLFAEACDRMAALDSGQGVLVLTDMYGGTPANIACRLAGDHRVCVLAGVNLPMLVRILNYADLSLHEIAAKALEGGREGVMICGGDCQ